MKTTETFFENAHPAIVIPDVHGSLNWKKFVEKRGPGDRVIFLGDYFDRRGHGPFARSDVQNFREICEYARSNPDTHLLVGNHDFDYTPFADVLPQAWWNLEANRQAVQENLDLLKMVFVDYSGAEPLLFSHGGVTTAFMNLYGCKTPEDLNTLWRKRPEVFEWQSHDPVSGEMSDRYGDNIWQSPIWARIMALTGNGVPGFNQVVGHTPVRSPEMMTTVNGDRFLLTCTLDDTPVRVGKREYW